MLSRRRFLLTSAFGLAGSRRLLAAGPSPVITVYKDPSCECCVRWIKHLNSNGFVVTVHDSTNMDEVKRTIGIPAALQSCHTAVVDKYAIEGHVPADVIKKFLAEHPASVVGLAAPGMPKGSPGMEGGTPDHYNIIAFNRDGSTRVYAKR